MTMFNHAPHGSNYYDHVYLYPGYNPQPPDEEMEVVEQGPMWYCENEECGVCINDDRYQCAGCGRWFCFDCTQSFTRDVQRVCSECLRTWLNLCQARGLNHAVGLV